MRALIPDTSVYVALERSSLLEAAFRLPFCFCVPDLLYERELQPCGGEELIKSELTIKELDGAGVELATGYRQSMPELSFPDCFAPMLAQSNGQTLLTGDRKLRELAEREGVTCHGFLWVLDHIHKAGTADLQSLHDGLSKLSRHPGCRPPRDAVKRRLKIYGKSPR